jgi:predicted glycoside hydrolase/deacetylase ChbG (UPF0249 family)
MWEVIINADDFGAMEKVNVAIDAHLSEGVISSASIIANGKYVEQAIAISKKHKQASFGIHLNLSEGKPMSDHADLAPLLDNEGNFKADFRGVPLTKLVKKAIVQEWLAQIAFLRGFGLEISHADSHHHVHTRPNLLWVVKKVAQESGIKHWRRSRTLYTADKDERLKTFLKKQYNVMLGAAFANTKGTTHFTDIHAMLHYVNDGQPDTVEVMCHPGLSNSAQEDELLKKLVKHPKIILKNYRQI